MPTAFLLGSLIFIFLAIAVMFGSKRYLLAHFNWKGTFSIYVILALTCLAIYLIFTPKKTEEDQQDPTAFNRYTKTNKLTANTALNYNRLYYCGVIS